MAKARESTRWSVEEAPFDENELHIVPSSEKHFFHNCPCHPNAEFVFKEDDSNVLLFTHNSYDKDDD